LDFQTGLATQLPYQDKKFDLVFFGFCLYLIEPNEIFKAVMEADRVLRNGGFLAILDFDYGQLCVNPYKHAPGIFSYKNHYSQIFTSSNYFHQISKWSFSHSDNSFTAEKDERLSIEVLYKELF
jgi:ubiquinone/menaquinone biosynthesis C-methylase UbiE